MNKEINKSLGYIHTLYIYMYVSYVYICVCMYVYMCVHAYMHIYIYTLYLAEQNPLSVTSRACRWQVLSVPCRFCLVGGLVGVFCGCLVGFALSVSLLVVKSLVGALSVALSVTLSVPCRRPCRWQAKLGKCEGAKMSSPRGHQIEDVCGEIPCRCLSVFSRCPFCRVWLVGALSAD